MGEGTQKLCYIVDDDTAVLRALKRGLQARYRDRIRFEIFPWGSEALKACQVQLPDLLITDLESSDLRGDVTIAEMRRLKPDLPVILMSGNHKDLADLEKTITDARFLDKPAGVDAFQKAIDELLGLQTTDLP